MVLNCLIGNLSSIPTRKKELIPWTIEDTMDHGKKTIYRTPSNRDMAWEVRQIEVVVC